MKNEMEELVEKLKEKIHSLENIPDDEREYYLWEQYHKKLDTEIAALEAEKEPGKSPKIKTPEEILTRGKGNFINCTDYDDAIEAMKEYALQFKEQPITDEEINKEAVRRATTNTDFIREPERAWFEKGAKWARDKMRGKE